MPGPRWFQSGGRGQTSSLEIGQMQATFTWLLEPMIECAGFRIDDADYSVDGIFARYVVHRR
jgi:hypothetical protein